MKTNNFMRKLLKAFREYSSSKYELIKAENTYHVHELLSCKYKSHLMREIPELNRKVKPKIFIGESIDTFIRILVEKNNELKKYLENEKTIHSRTVFVNDKEKIVIVGKPDIELKDKIIEIKYTSTTRGLPKKHHVEQLRFYLFLTGKKEGVLFYVTNDDFIEFKVNEPMTEDEVMKYYKNWSSPMFSWECKVCNFKDICPHYQQKTKRK